MAEIVEIVEERFEGASMFFKVLVDDFAVIVEAKKIPTTFGHEHRYLFAYEDGDYSVDEDIVLDVRVVVERRLDQLELEKRQRKERAERKSLRERYRNAVVST